MSFTKKEHKERYRLHCKVREIGYKVDSHRRTVFVSMNEDLPPNSNTSIQI